MSTVWQYALAGGLAAWYLSVQAGRLDRLHRNVETLQAALDAHLARRSALLAELIPFLDPACAAVASQATHDALTCDPDDVIARTQAENIVTAAIGDVFGDADDLSELCRIPAVRELLTDLVAANRKAAMSRRFHADAVHACRHVRNQRLVRLFRLAGRAPEPVTFDFADDLPTALTTAAGG